MTAFSPASPSSLSDPAAVSASHRIVRTLWHALRLLGVEAMPAEVESWGLSVHCALASTARQFHSHEHVLELAEGAAPLEAIAALYHDVVYVHVDGQLPRSMAPILDPLLERIPEGWRIRIAALGHIEHESTRLVLDVFGRRVGDVLGPMSGLNELASALVAAVHLGHVLDRDSIVAIAACIEATIPFRADPGGVLSARLQAMGLGTAHAAEIVRCALRVANRDVGNFADDDPARFLANTWKLLPETNPSLNVPSRYSVSDYRIALMKMEAFLENLPADRVFHAWGGEPSSLEHAQRVNAAAANISMAVRYLRTKLYAIAVVEALCIATGGDLPLQYVLGVVQRRGERGRLESFLPPPVSGARESESTLHRLLSTGRASPSSFPASSDEVEGELTPSPLAAHVLELLGEERIIRGVENARSWWAKEMSAEDFLAHQPPTLVASLARAAAALAETRRDALLAIVRRLGSTSSIIPAAPKTGFGEGDVEMGAPSSLRGFSASA
jgi:hypothetical protein